MREILFLTDGGVSGHEEERILSLVAGGSKSMVSSGSARDHLAA